MLGEKLSASEVTLEEMNNDVIYVSLLHLCVYIYI